MGANRNKRKNPRGALEQEAAGRSSHREHDSGEKVVVNTFRSQEGTNDVGINLVKATFSVKE